MTGRIIVINPNSTEAVTEAMDRALDPLRMAGAPEIESVTNTNGPAGIECQAHADDVSRDIRSLIAERDGDAAAFVIACFSDPGIYAAREATARPVFGIAESGMLTAMSLGARIGVIAILNRSIPRHMRYFRGIGVEGRVANDRAIELGVVELADEGKTFERMVQVGTTLRDTDGADVLVMGCAGMARYRERLSDRLGIPVVDPTQAAVSMAIGAVQLRQTNGQAVAPAIAAE